MKKAAIKLHRPDGSPKSPGAALRCRPSAWLGLFLLLFNVLAAPAIAPKSGPAGAFAAELSGGTVLCTSQGLLVLDADGKTRPAGDSSGHGGICLFCLPLMHGGGGAPLAEILVEPPISAVRLAEFPASPRSPTIGVGRVSHPARAPPALA